MGKGREENVGKEEKKWMWRVEKKGQKTRSKREPTVNWDQG